MYMSQKNIILTCNNCGNSFERYIGEHRRQLKNGKTKFYCTYQCAMVSVGEKKKLVPVKKLCVICGVEFFNKPLKFGSKKCCSPTCSHTLSGKIQSDKWKDYISPKIVRPTPLGWVKGQAFDPKRETLRRSKIRKSIEARYASGWAPKAGRCKKIRYTSPICGEVLLDGQWELEVAKFLDSENIHWNRNETRFEYRDGEKIRHYTPDFYLLDMRAYLEVKGYETELDRTKWKQFPEKMYIFRKREIDLIRKRELPKWENCLLNNLTT